MNIVDSSAWLEYFADTKHAKHFAQVIEQTEELLVPSITLYEVFKKILTERNEDEAMVIVAHMKRGTVIDLDLDISLRAASLSVKHALPMADSVILATAQRYKATLWTMDSDFKDMPGVRFFSKR